MDEMQRIVDDLFRSGLTIEQQCNVSSLLTFIATHFVARQTPLTSTERSRNCRSRQKAQRATLPVAQKKEKKQKKENIYNNIYTPRDELKTVLDEERAEAVICHRQKLRKPLTVRAAKLLATEFAKSPNPNSSADEMIARGWQGFKQEWLDRDNKPSLKTNGFKPAGKPLEFRAKIEEEIEVTPEERARRIKVIEQLKEAAQAMTR